MRGNYERANAIALRGYEGDDARLYASLKLSGMDDAPLQLAVSLIRRQIGAVGSATRQCRKP